MSMTPATCTSLFHYSHRTLVASTDFSSHIDIAEHIRIQLTDDHNRREHGDRWREHTLHLSARYLPPYITRATQVVTRGEVRPSPSNCSSHISPTKRWLHHGALRSRRGGVSGSHDIGLNLVFDRIGWIASSHDPLIEGTLGP